MDCIYTRGHPIWDETAARCSLILHHIWNSSEVADYLGHSLDVVVKHIESIRDSEHRWMSENGMGGLTVPIPLAWREAYCLDQAARLIGLDRSDLEKGIRDGKVRPINHPRGLSVVGADLVVEGLSYVVMQKRYSPGDRFDLRIQSYEKMGRDTRDRLAAIYREPYYINQPVISLKK